MAVLFLEIQIANALTNLLSELGGLWTAGRPLGNNPDERIVPILFCIAGPETGSGKQLPILRINVAPSKLLQRRISGVEPNAVRYFIAIVAFADDAAESAMLAKL